MCKPTHDCLIPNANQMMWNNDTLLTPMTRVVQDDKLTLIFSLVVGWYEMGSEPWLFHSGNIYSFIHNPTLLIFVRGQLVLNSLSPSLVREFIYGTLQCSIGVWEQVSHRYTPTHTGLAQIWMKFQEVLLWSFLFVRSFVVVVGVHSKATTIKIKWSLCVRAYVWVSAEWKKPKPIQEWALAATLAAAASHKNEMNWTEKNQRKTTSNIG